nr:plant UBX domain-containing protein 1 [Ipomoea batatas]
MILDSPAALKRRRLTTADPMEAESAKAQLAAAKEKFGREIRVFSTITNSPSSSDVSNNEVSDDFYEFTAEDYYRILATKKEDKYLKTKKIREAEEAARRSKITKVVIRFLFEILCIISIFNCKHFSIAISYVFTCLFFFLQTVIRVRFPDNFTLEATFHPSETIQNLADLLIKVVVRPDLPFYLYTTPPKKQIKDLSQDFYSAGFVPGAIVYFSYDVPKGDDVASGNYLKEEVLSLQGLEFKTTQAEPVQSVPEPALEAKPTPAQEQKPPAEKKNIKPKWLKM